MPVLVEPHGSTVTSLIATLPPGSQAVAAPDPMLAWLDQHPDEYVVVLGPGLGLEAALAVSDHLRAATPTVSVVLVVEDLDTALLARAMKAGARDVVRVDDPAAVEAAVRQAFELHQALRGPAGARHVGRVVTVFSPKGGVGKTTMAVNLALALTEGGARKVCLVDLDLAFGDVAITMQLLPTHSIEQAIDSEDALDLPTLEGLLTRHQDSLMVLAAPLRPDVRERITPMLVARILRTLKEGFDFVVVDTPPAFDDQILTVLDETDECVVVASLDVPTLKNLKVALETLDVLNIARGHRHLLLNRADDAVGLDSTRVEAILEMPVSTRVGTSVDIAASTNAGTPIMAADPRHPSSQAIRSLASTLAGVPVAPPPPVNGEAALAAPRAPRRLFRRAKA